jgi:hypothetical protein
MENNEIMVTEETKNAVEGVAKSGFKPNWWTLGGAVGALAVVGTVVGICLYKKKKAKQAEKETESKDWTEKLDETVEEIKNENID